MCLSAEGHEFTASMSNTVDGSPCGVGLLLRSADVLCASLNGRGKGAGILLRGTVKSYDCKFLCDFPARSGGEGDSSDRTFPMGRSHWSSVSLFRKC